MDIVKIPKMQKEEYDRMIRDEYVCRIAFEGPEHPYIAPFLYVFDGRYLYFLSTMYGRKIEYFKKKPSVSVEIETYSRDMSDFHFISLQGNLEEVTLPPENLKARQNFVSLITTRGLSPKVLTALGHSSSDPPGVLLKEGRNLVWKLVGVKDIVALKNG